MQSVVCCCRRVPARRYRLSAQLRPIKKSSIRRLPCAHLAELAEVLLEFRLANIEWQIVNVDARVLLPPGPTDLYDGAIVQRVLFGLRQYLEAVLENYDTTCRIGGRTLSAVSRLLNATWAYVRLAPVS